MSYEVIAIGASWGGLQAVGTLLEGIPDELDQAIVVAQHRSPESSRGVLAQGQKETIRFSPHERAFEELDADERLFKKVG